LQEICSDRHINSDDAMHKSLVITGYKTTNVTTIILVLYKKTDQIGLNTIYDNDSIISTKCINMHTGLMAQKNIVYTPIGYTTTEKVSIS